MVALKCIVEYVDSLRELEKRFKYQVVEDCALVRVLRARTVGNEETTLLFYVAIVRPVGVVEGIFFNLTRVL